jgi:hypothetical protein
MNTKLILIAVLGLSIAGAVDIVSAAGQPAVPSAGAKLSFQGVTNIVFSTWIYGDKPDKGYWKRFSVADPGELLLLLPAGQVEPTHADEMHHRYAADFQSATGTIHASFDRGSFEIHNIPGLQASESRYYKMPKEFFAEFKKLAQKHGWPTEP